MRFSSSRKRPVHLGMHPLERLPRGRAPEPAPQQAIPPSPHLRDEGPLAGVARAYLRLYEQLRDGAVAAERAPIPDDPAGMAHDVKAGCYFMDASLVGIGPVPASAWRQLPVAGAPAHHTAIVIVVAHAREPEADNRAAAWTRGAQDERAAMRSAEIGCIAAGYIRRLGFSARCHSRDESEVDHGALALAAGVGRREGDAVVAPFLGRNFGTAVVTTDLDLAHDAPLAALGPLTRLTRERLPDWLGLGGARPGFDRWLKRRRASHLSAYPMERIKRVDDTTTLILENEVPRVSKRAAFFERALKGDLGDKSQRERTRFALKHPFTESMAPLLRAMVPIQDGPVADRVAPGTDDAEANARAVKSLCYYLNADLVGVCEAKPYAWYSHDSDGVPIDTHHKYAVVLLIDQGYETMEGASGDDWISGGQSMRGYLRGAEITGQVAALIRGLGYAARSHSNLDSEVLHIPLILLAGLGELSRIGELVLNPFVGPRFKSAVITTDMPLAVDKPIDFGLQDMCGKCMKCARECPCDAISMGDKVMFNGYEMWKPDVERCTRYRLTNRKGAACGRCMKMCPYNHEGLLVHHLFLWAAIKVPFLRKWIAVLDDKVGNGRRNPVKRWWQDLEMVDGVAVKPMGVNERDLDLDRVLQPDKQKIAYYHAAMMPPPDVADPSPIDRKAALAAASLLETPAQARARRQRGRPAPAHYTPTQPRGTTVAPETDGDAAE